MQKGYWARDLWLGTTESRRFPWEKFLSAGQKTRIARNKKYEQTVYAELRKRLEAKIAKK